MSVTIWDTLADPPAVATRIDIVGHTEPEGDEAPEPIYGDPVKLERLTDAKWRRPMWSAELRADPSSHGAANFRAGERILDDVTVPPSIPSGKKRGLDREAPLVDLEAATATWYTLVDLDAGDLAAMRAAAAAAKRAAINAERERRVYLPIGQIDVRGDGTLMVEPDIRNEQDRHNLIAIHTRAHELATAGVTSAVIAFGAADNLEYDLTPAEAMKVCSAPFDRAAGLYQAARTLKSGALQDAIDAEDLAAINAVDPTDDAHWS